MMILPSRNVLVCLLASLPGFFPPCLFAQETSPSQPASTPAAPNPVTINAGRIAPKYPMPYKPASVAEIIAVLQRLHGYLDSVTPTGVIDRETRKKITDFSQPNPLAVIERGDFLIMSYEWGVTYSGMMRASEVTGDARYNDYVAKRLRFIADAAPVFAIAPMPPLIPGSPEAALMARTRNTTLRGVLAPRSLDECGSLCAAMIKAQRAGIAGDLRPRIDNYIEFISKSQFRLADGTLARHTPLPDALWLDDLYMSVPALAQMSKLTGEPKYLEDAIKQVRQFSARMFVKEKGLYMHGWISGMDVHPAFHWARANGWALLATTELLDVMPDDHPARENVLALYRAHVRGLANCQSAEGMWHQLLDRPDSYLETSASAIFVYCIAHGINRGWLDPLAHGPLVSLGWNAVAQKVNDKGQVEGTCVGTGMGFDPAFYCYRPTSVYAAHGYGPVMLAGAEMIALRQGKGKDALLSDGAVQMMRAPAR